jgi:hypothetical protein
MQPPAILAIINAKHVPERKSISVCSVNKNMSILMVPVLAVEIIASRVKLTSHPLLLYKICKNYVKAASMGITCLKLLGFV